MACKSVEQFGQGAQTRQTTDHATEKLAATGKIVRAIRFLFLFVLQDIVAERRLRMAGHIIRMSPGRPANRAMSWTPRGSGRKRGRSTKTWRSTFKKDLVDREVNWNSVRAVATDRHRWRTLAAHCPDKGQRT